MRDDFEPRTFSISIEWENAHIGLFAVWRDDRQRLRDALARIRRNRTAVKLGPAGGAAAAAIAFVYLSLQVAGGAVTLARPDLLPRLPPI
jgi:hypothetical protein